MTMLKKSMIGEYILFFDREDELRAGKIYDIEESKLSIHSLRKNSRGSSKLYYYSLKESDVFKIVSQDCAIQFVNEEGIVVRRKKESLSRKSSRNIKNILIGLNDTIEFSEQLNIKNKYDVSLDRFGLDQLDYKMLEMLLSNSTFSSLSERTSKIDLVRFVGRIYYSPSISDYYSSLIRLYYLREVGHSITKYKEGEVKRGEYMDIFKEGFSFLTNWVFLTGIDFHNPTGRDVFLEISINTTSYVAILKILIEKNWEDHNTLTLKDDVALFDYLLKVITNELVANGNCWVGKLEQFKYIEFFEFYREEQLRDALVSTVKKIEAATSLKVEYRFDKNAIYLRWNQISSFNKRFFNHSEEYVYVGDFIRTLSNMIRSDE